MIIHTPAIVLKSFPYGDTSIIARCFTKEKGKISLIVKGGRSKKSSKSAQFQPLSFIEIIYTHRPNRDLQVLSKANFCESWINILKDLRSVTLSMTILEITEKTLSEEDPYPKLFSILIDVLRNYNTGDIDPKLLFWYYECALLTHLGFRPNLDETSLPGLQLPNPNSGPNSGIILATLLAGDINALPKEDITSQDRKIISDYLSKLLRYHFDSLENSKSIKIARKILSD